MADLRAALGHALEPAYRVEREVRPVGNCRMFVALEKSAGGGLLVKVLPGPLSLAVDSTRFEQGIARLGHRLRHPSLVAPRGAGRAGSLVYHTRTFVEGTTRSEEHTSELQSQSNLVCRLLLEKKKNKHKRMHGYNRSTLHARYRLSSCRHL